MLIELRHYGGASVKTDTIDLQILHYALDAIARFAKWNAFYPIHRIHVGIARIAILLHPLIAISTSNGCVWMSSGIAQSQIFDYPRLSASCRAAAGRQRDNVRPKDYSSEGWTIIGRDRDVIAKQHRPDAALTVLPSAPPQALAESSEAVTSTTSPSRMGFAIPKKRATVSELLWASIAA